MRLENKSGRAGRDEEQREEWRDETHNNAGGEAPRTSNLPTP